LVGAALLPSGDARLRAAPVRVADAGAAVLLQAGDHIDVLATPPDGAGATRVVASDVVVLAVPRAEDAVASDDGALVVVAVPATTAADLAGAAVTARLSVTIRGGSG
jgi:hypothetical protein